jgi:hypothetical protein
MIGEWGHDSIQEHFPQGQKSQGMKLTTNFHLVLKLMSHRVIIFSHICLHSMVLNEAQYLIFSVLQLWTGYCGYYSSCSTKPEEEWSMKLPTEQNLNKNFTSSGLKPSYLYTQIAHFLDFFSCGHKIRPVSDPF